MVWRVFAGIEHPFRASLLEYTFVGLVQSVAIVRAVFAAVNLASWGSFPALPTLHGSSTILV